MALSPGDTAPVFTLHDQNNALFSLESHRGEWVLIYFYPRAMTPGCTIQACGLRDAWGELQRRGVVVVGVSPDSPARLQTFATKEGLPFTLLSDEDHSVASLYGVWGEKVMYGKRVVGITRKSFLINPAGAIYHIIHKVDTKTHADKVIQLMDIARETI